MHARPNPAQTRRRVTGAAFITAVALALAACGGAAADDGGTAAEVPPGDATAAASTAATDPAPTTEFELFDGSRTSFGAFAGQPLVVNFWASWCPSCVAEMSAAFRPLQEQLGAQVAFLGMNIQDQRALALELLAETGVQWVNAEDPTGTLYTELGGLGMPFTVLIDADGGIVDTHNGPLTEAQLRDKLAEHFGV